jgi:hypothetical protein
MSSFKNMKLTKAGWVLSVASVSLANHAFAQDEQPPGVLLEAGTGYASVDNLFATSTNAVSDQIYSENLGILVNGRYSLQNLSLVGRISNTHYQNHSDLNFIGSNLAMRWEWTSGTGLLGSVSADHSVTQNSAAVNADTSGQRNLNTSNTAQGMVGYDFGGGWQMVSGIVQNKTNNERSVLGQTNYNYQGGYLGVDYTSASGALIDVKSTLSSGSNSYQYQSRTDEIRAQSSADDALQLTISWAYVQQIYSEHPEFNFSGQNLNLGSRWDITGKTSLSTSLQRQISALPTATSVYVTSDNFRIAPTWNFLPKTSLRVEYINNLLRFQGNPTGTNNEVSRFISWVTAIDWRPTNAALISLSYSQSDRDRSVESAIARIQRTAITATITF